MSVYKKGAGLLRVVYKSNLKTAPKKVSMIGNYYPFNDGLDAYQWFEVEGLPATPTEKELLEGNPDRLSYYVPSDITDIIPPLGVLFPNCTVYVVGNTEQVVSGLPDADAVAIVPNTLKSSYLADPVYSTYQNLTFDSWILQNETTIPFVGNTTLTASFVRLFYENAGGQASTVGKIIVAPEYTDFETGVFDLVFALFENCEEIEYGGLPSAYQAVEYIESTGTQWIDSRYVFLKTTTIESDYEFTTNTTSGNRLFGTGISGNLNAFLTFQATKSDANCTARYQLATTVGNIASDFNRHTVVFNDAGHNISIDGLVIANLSAYNSFNENAPSLCILTTAQADDKGLEEKNGRAKLYSFKIYEGSTLVRDFVPCYRKADSEIGLYDMVNRVFYTNQGTGVFLKGSDVANLTETISRPSLATATIVGSGTLTAQKVADTLAQYPEFATAERVVVPDDFTEYESGAIDAIFGSFSNMTDLESPWVSGPTNYLGFTIPYDGTQSSVDKAYVQRYIDLLLKDDLVKNNVKKVTIAEGFAPPGAWQSYAGVFSSSDALDPCKELGMVEVDVKSPSVTYYWDDVKPNVRGFAKVSISQRYGGGNVATLRDNQYFVRSTCDKFVLNVIPTTSGGMSLDIWHAYTWTIPPRVLKVTCPVDLALDNSDSATFISSVEYDMDEFIIQNLISSIDIRFMVLTRQQCVAFFNALGTASTQQTITLNATTYTSLSAADIAIATAKNFQVVSA